MQPEPSPTYRTHTTTHDIQVRQDSEDGVFEVRMPIATTGEVRNEGDDPLTRDELQGMATQVNQGSLGVFLDHGSTSLGGPARYSAVEKIGEWSDATVDGERDDGTDALVATAQLMDPETLPSATGSLRENLAAIKEQVDRGMSLSASIGWREDDAYPGGNDLMEASIVGIGADPRTTSDSAGVGVVARAAVEAGLDPDELLGVVERAVRGTDAEHDMTNDEDESTGGDVDTEQDGEPDETQDAPDWAARLLELQEAQTETLNSLADALRQDDDEDDEEDEEENASDEDEDEDDEDDEEQSAEDSELEERISEMEDALQEIRSGNEGVESPGAGDDETTTTETETEQSTTTSESSDPNGWRDLA